MCGIKQTNDVFEHKRKIMYINRTETHVPCTVYTMWMVMWIQDWTAISKYICKKGTSNLFFAMANTQDRHITCYAFVLLNELQIQIEKSEKYLCATKAYVKCVLLGAKTRIRTHTVKVNDGNWNTEVLQSEQEKRNKKTLRTATTNTVMLLLKMATFNAVWNSSLFTWIFLFKWWWVML